jgi:hypothetical protein
MNQRLKATAKQIAYLFLAGCLLGAVTQPLAAQVTIPQGSTVNSAIFSIWISHSTTNKTVTLHRITSGWDEHGVTWNNFGSAYDLGEIGSIVTDISYGWKTVNLTSLVQGWVNGQPNYGFLMKQGETTPYTNYISSEWADIVRRPKLEISYTTPSGVLNTVVIQRPDVDQSGVADAYISEQLPYINGGDSQVLTTGLINTYVKVSLVRFDFTVIPPSSPGTGTPGYWMNHPEAWPVAGIEIGNIYYSMEEAIALMKAPVATDKTYTMFAALVAAKLNVMIGNDASCIASTITAADEWMATYPVGSGVSAGGPTSPWRVGEPLYLLLDNYNNGLLCAPARY